MTDKGTPMRGDEMATMEKLVAFEAVLKTGNKNLEQRIKSIDGGWREYRVALSAIDRLLPKLYETMTSKHLRNIENMLRHGRVVIRVNAAASETDYTLAAEDDLETIINAAMGSECALCLKEGADAKRCELRKALINICPPEGDDGNGCWYARHAATRPLKDYFVTEK